MRLTNLICLICPTTHVNWYPSMSSLFLILCYTFDNMKKWFYTSLNKEITKKLPFWLCLVLTRTLLEVWLVRIKSSRYRKIVMKIRKFTLKGKIDKNILSHSRYTHHIAKCTTCIMNTLGAKYFLSINLKMLVIK